MSVYMRNKASGEIREVAPDSEEFRELRAQVTPAGLSMWEQTSFPHADAIKTRADNDELLDHDLGHEDQERIRYAALELDAAGVAAENNPHLALTPGELEEGLTPEGKLEDLRQMSGASRAKRAEIFSDAASRVASKEPAKSSGSKASAAKKETSSPAASTS